MTEEEKNEGFTLDKLSDTGFSCILWWNEYGGKRYKYLFGAHSHTGSAHGTGKSNPRA